jgi:hypothetical protein
VRERFDAQVELLLERLERLSLHMEKMSIAEYLKLVENPVRMMGINFLAGIARGFGLGLGATVIAAVFLYLLGRLANMNIPYIGHFIARIARIVAEQL